ncbi:MAG: xanthine dehydrogenase family protein subunit M [Alphaproteobacteria bacterium]|nr:xanthine dehydrogenase family protein subunit M [Alphaproteobacteria bacterium]
MKPPAFEYVAAGSVEEAVSLLAQHDGEAKVIAGGQSLVPMLNFRLLAPAVLVDLNRIPGLDGVTEHDGGLRIGALTRHRTLETSDVIKARFPVLNAAMQFVAHLAIRNRGTIGGSLCHADPAAELPTMAVLLDAEIEAAGPDGERVIAARDFFESALATTLEEDEIVTGVRLPALPAQAGWAFEEFARRSGDFGIAGVGATIALQDDIVAEARVALLGVGQTPLRASAAEKALQGQRHDAELIAAAAEAAREAAEPEDDLHGSADYRRHLVGVLTRRALEAAWRRASGEAS